MEKTKLISLLNRSYEPKFKNMTASHCLSLFNNDIPFTIFKDKMEAIDIIIFSFMLPYAESGIDLSKFYDEIKYNLFAYSYFEITSDDVYVSCNSCGGDGDSSCSSCAGVGSINCSDCDGRGSIDCEYCDGDGEYLDGDICSHCHGNGYKDCNTCEGTGDEECPECDGIGTENCGYCEGTGEVEDESLVRIYQYFFVSYNPKIKDSLLIKEEFEILSPDTQNILMNNRKTMLLNTISSDTDIHWDEGDAGDALFVEVTDEPNFVKKNNYIDVPGIAKY